VYRSIVHLHLESYLDFSSQKRYGKTYEDDKGEECLDLGNNFHTRSDRLTLQPGRKMDRYMIKTYRHMQNDRFCGNRGMTALDKNNKKTDQVINKQESTFFQHIIK